MKAIVLFVQDRFEDDCVAAAGPRSRRLLLLHHRMMLHMGARVRWMWVLLLLLLLALERLSSPGLILVVRVLVFVLET